MATKNPRYDLYLHDGLGYLIGRGHGDTEPEALLMMYARYPRARGHVARYFERMR